jgi:PQQ-dependent dehydrogenase (s-GDH family)
MVMSKRKTFRAAGLSTLALALLATTGSAFAQLEKIPGLPMTPEPVEQGDASLFSMRVLTAGLANPWSVRWGPDDYLWVTERTESRVTRVHPVDGTRQVVLTIEGVVTGSQQGLLGLVLHPELLQGTGNDYVYVSHTYDATGGAGELDRKGKIVRYTYDQANNQLIEPLEIMTGIPAGTDHNSGRMQMGPDGMLYYAAGDQGQNQFRNFRNPILSQLLPTAEQVEGQDWVSYTGKILRMNLDGSIPDDNPEIEGVRSHIYSYGHRNPQGIAFSDTGNLYSVEHGPSSDDELNLVTPGGNYGWPDVSGFRDDMGYRYVNWSEAPADLEWEINPLLAPDTVPMASENDFEAEMVDPMAAYWTVEDGFPFNEQCGIVCDPTIAPTSVYYYRGGEGGIAEWDNVALIATLKHGVIYAQPLSEDGTEAEGEPVQWLPSQNRYRDLVVGPDNRTVYIVTDSGGATTPLYGDLLSTNVNHNPGSILMFTYEGDE